MKILVTCPRVEPSKELFDSFFVANKIKPDFVYPIKQGFASEELKKLYDGHEILIVGDDEVDKNFLLNTESLKYIIKWGKGTDNVNKGYCLENGITLYNSPGKIAKYVAEHGLALIHSINKNIEQNRSSLNLNTWYKESSESLFNKTVGFYGFGAIAKEFAQLLIPYNSNIIYFDIQKIECEYSQVSIEKLFKSSDILIVASELTNENIGAINFNLIKKMHKGSILINISRGKIINESDLITALEKNIIRGAGLDVFENEPLAQSNKLINFDNVVLTCHNASNTEAASREVNEQIISILERII